MVSSTDTKKILLSKANSFLRGDLTPFISNKFTNLRPLLSITFPQEFQISKIFGHLTSGRGGKKTFKR